MIQPIHFGIPHVVDVLHEKFQSGLVESFGKTNISVGPKINPAVSLINVGT